MLWIEAMVVSVPIEVARSVRSWASVAVEHRDPLSLSRAFVLLRLGSTLMLAELRM